MGSIIGGITDAVGLTDHKGEEAARKQAAQAASQSAATSQQSLAMTQAQLDFQKDQYYEWKDIYGDLQEDLGTYYKNLTGETLAASQIEAIQAESQGAQTQIDKNLAQRGISGSGLEASLASQNIFQTSQSKAIARSSADELANQKKMGFLGLGLGQGTEMLGINASVANAGAANLMGRSSSLLSNSTALSGQATQLSMANMDAMATLNEQIARGVGSYMSSSDIRFKDNRKLLKTVKGFNIYSWDWNALGKEVTGYTGRDQGVIAQEVLEIQPEAVIKNGEYLMVIPQNLPKEVQEEISYGK